MTLHFAALRGDIRELMEALKYASVNDKDQYGDTPLHLAAHHGHVIISMKLLELNADVNSRDKYGETPLHRAAYGGHIVKSKRRH